MPILRKFLGSANWSIHGWTVISRYGRSRWRWVEEVNRENRARSIQNTACAARRTRGQWCPFDSVNEYLSVRGLSRAYHAWNMIEADTRRTNKQTEEGFRDYYTRLTISGREEDFFFKIISVEGTILHFRVIFRNGDTELLTIVVSRFTMDDRC